MFGAVSFRFLNLSSFHEIKGARWLRPTAEVPAISCKKKIIANLQDNLDDEGGSTARGGAAVGPTAVLLF